MLLDRCAFYISHLISRLLHRRRRATMIEKVSSLYLAQCIGNIGVFLQIMTTSLKLQMTIDVLGGHLVTS